MRCVDSGQLARHWRECCVAVSCRPVSARLGQEARQGMGRGSNCVCGCVCVCMCIMYMCVDVDVKRVCEYAYIVYICDSTVPNLFSIYYSRTARLARSGSMWMWMGRHSVASRLVSRQRGARTAFASSSMTSSPT